MSEITKLYENCGIKNYRLENWCGLVPDGWKIIPEDNDENKVKEIVRDFSADKQLELIKWLAETGEVCRIDATVKNKWFVENEVGYGKCFAKFEDALANVINIIWEYMPEEEKQQVKGILE